MEVGVSQRTRSSRILGTVAVVLTLSACGRVEKAAPPTPPKPVVDLPKDINQMTAGELWEAGNQLTPFWDRGEPTHRNCAQGGAGGCIGRIDAVKDTTPGPGSVSPFGTIVARLENLGAQGTGADRGPEQKYRMEKETGPDDKKYYIIARPDGSGGWTYSVRVAIKNSTKVPSDSTAWGSWLTCSSTYPNHPTTKSAFFWCPSTLMTSSLTAEELASPRVYNPLDPGWLECSAGCCTAGQ